MEKQIKATNRKHLRWVIAAGIVVILGFAGSIIVRRMLDADYLETRFASALSKATDGLYRIEIGELEFSLFRNSLVATDIHLYPDSAVLRDSTRVTAPEGLYSVFAPHVEVDGTNLWSLVNGRIKASSLTLLRPHLSLALDSRRAPELDSAEIHADTSAPNADGRGSFHARLGRQLPSMEIGSLRIDSGSFSWERRSEDGMVRDSVGSIFVEIDDIDTGPESAADNDRVFFSENLSFRVGRYDHMSADSMYTMSIDSVTGSTRDGTLTVSALKYAPTMSDAVRKQRLRDRETRYIIEAPQITLRDLAFRPIVEESRIAIGSVTLQKPALDVYVDRTIPKLGVSGPKRLPHVSLRNISWLLQLDTVIVDSGDVIYRERDEEAMRPGTMRFGNMTATLTGIYNDGATGEGGSRAIADLRTRVNDGGTLVAHLEYDLSARGLNMSFKGSLSGMRAAAFNEVLVDLEGIKVESGAIDTAWFDVNVVRDSATGRVQVVYDSLSIAFVNRETGKTGFFNRLKSILANTMKLERRNIATDKGPPLIADVAIRRAPDKPLLGFIWVCVRQGLLTTLGL